MTEHDERAGLPSGSNFPRSNSYKDLSGQKFGRLRVIEFSHIRSENAVFKCICDCGTICFGTTGKLKSGRKQSCGCLMFERAKEANLIHGKVGTRIYRIWAHMLSRCRNPKHIDWKNYGGRGIRVCDEWNSFEAFYADMGSCPDGMTLDRIDNEKGYSKGNCRWATYGQQAINKRDTKFSMQDIEDIRASYKQFTFKELAEIFGVHWQTISKIVRHKTYVF